MADLRPNIIVITGASSGIGKATARLFVDKGWNVVATMRNPAAEKDLKESARLKLVALDVQDPAGPKAAVAEAIKAFGRIDVWLNNAGYGAFGPVEAGTPEQIRRQFDVNVFGLIACVQAVAPHFRANKAGVLINVSSIGGIMTVPAFSVYNATKFAVEGLSEGLWYELGSFGIRVKVIEPGAIKTEFRRSLGGRLGRLPRARICAVHGQGERLARQVHPEFELARTCRRGHLQGGHRPKRPHALSRRSRRASVYSAAAPAWRAPHDENDQAAVPALDRRPCRTERLGAPPMLEHFSSRGVDIAFIDVAPQAHDLGEPILLIHGFASNHRVNWVDPRWVETLAKAGRRVVAFDNRGHGQSEKLYSPADYRADLMTQDAANLLAHLRIERADVMGYSMGARIASFLALAEPKRGARADPGRDRRPAGARRRAAGGDRRGDGGAVARQPRRSDAAHVPRLRRPDEERPGRARRLRPRLAAESHAERTGAHRPAGAGRGRRRATPSRAIPTSSPPCCRGERRSTFPAAITISRSATARSRPERSIFSPAENEPPPFFVIY